MATSNRRSASVGPRSRHIQSKFLVQGRDGREHSVEVNNAFDNESIDHQTSSYDRVQESNTNHFRASRHQQDTKIFQATQLTARQANNVDKSQLMSIIQTRINEKTSELNDLDLEVSGLRYEDNQRAAWIRRRQQIVRELDNLKKDLHAHNNYKQYSNSSFKANTVDGTKVLAKKIEHLNTKCTDAESKLEHALQERRNVQAQLRSLQNKQRDVRQNLYEICSQAVADRNHSVQSTGAHSTRRGSSVGRRRDSSSGHLRERNRIPETTEIDRITKELQSGREQLDALEAKLANYLLEARKSDKVREKIMVRVAELRKLQHRRAKLQNIQDTKVTSDADHDSKKHLEGKRQVDSLRQTIIEEGIILTKLEQELESLSRELSSKTKQLELMSEPEFVARVADMTTRCTEVQKFIDSYEDYARAKRIITIDALNDEITNVRKTIEDRAKNYQESLERASEMKGRQQDRAFLQRTHSRQLESGINSAASQQQTAAYGMLTQRRKLRLELNNLDELKEKVDKELQSLRESLREGHDDESRLSNYHQDLNDYKQQVNKRSIEVNELIEEKSRIETLIKEKSKIMDTLKKEMGTSHRLDDKQLDMFIKILEDLRECSILREQLMGRLKTKLP